MSEGRIRDDIIADDSSRFLMGGHNVTIDALLEIRLLERGGRPFVWSCQSQHKWSILV